MFHRKKSGSSKKIKSRPIFLWLQTPLILLAILNAGILLVVLYVMNVPYQLNKNSYELCQKQVDNRQRFLQTQMTDNWSNIDDLAQYVNEIATAMVTSGTLNLELLDSSTSESTPLLLSITERMIQELYSKQASGIYLVFNTHNLEKDEYEHEWSDKTGIYIQDKDPLSASSEKYADLLLLCSPSKLVQQSSLSTSPNWEQKFKFDEENPYESWLTSPYLTAIENPSLSARDCGIWSFKQNETNKPSLTYTIPLRLSDGIVYGVLGIELLPTYLETLLPYYELDDSGFYGLYISDIYSNPVKDKAMIYPVSSKNSPYSSLKLITLAENKYNGYEITVDRTNYQVGLSPLSLYSRNTPFAEQQWYVLGAVPSGNLFAFSYRVNIMLLFTSLLILLLGAFSSMIFSWLIAKPIRGLQHELSSAEPGSIPDLSKTGISEVDNFAAAITDLSKNVVDSSKRFLSIMEMSSVEIGGYEVDPANNFFYVTDNFFPMFNRSDVNTSVMTCARFVTTLSKLQTSVPIEQTNIDSTIYAVRDKSGAVRYIHVKEKFRGSHRIGVAEDITYQVLERKHIERERDHDLLTGIYNRRAFFHESQNILRNPKELGIAIAVMLDLDNLKIVNDTYGHEWGDFYIISAAKCIQKYAPKHSVCSRVSGDEFNLLLYGFSSEEEAEQAMVDLWNGFHETELPLPDGQIRNVAASGGYVFVGDGLTDIDELIKYADFAMYKMKRTRKDWFAKFEYDQYHAYEIEKEKHDIFKRIIQNEAIRYVFHPIVSAKTAKMYGCEGLMRIMDSEQMNLADFLRIAKEDGSMGEIERLTWYHALPAFQKLMRDGIVSKTTKFFINSQVNHLLGPVEQLELITLYGDIRDQVVMEVVETDDSAIDFTDLKSQKDEIFAREFALDDYGSGYNSDVNLINLMPEYIKIDMSLIRNVEQYQERQKLIAGLLSFAHEKGMLVLAEGVETMAELHCLLTLGVDLFQGYLFARPDEHPGKLNQEAIDMLHTFIQAGKVEK